MVSDKEKIKLLTEIIVNRSSFTRSVSGGWYNINQEDTNLLIDAFNLILDNKYSHEKSRHLDLTISQFIDKYQEVFSLYGIDAPSRSPRYNEKFIIWETTPGEFY